MMVDDEWQYKVTINEPKWWEVQDWCEHNFGSFGRRWYKMGIDPAINLNNGTPESTWLFRHKKDAVLFSLRWSTSSSDKLIK